LVLAPHNGNRDCYQHTPLNVALFEEKAVRLNVALEEETVILAKETGRISEG
jgi:hypothetical protein